MSELLDELADDPARESATLCAEGTCYDASRDPARPLRHNQVTMAMAQRLRRKGLAPKAIVGASMRRLVHLIYGVVTSGKPFYAKIPLEGVAVQDGI